MRAWPPRLIADKMITEEELFRRLRRLG